MNKTTIIAALGLATILLIGIVIAAQNRNITNNGLVTDPFTITVNNVLIGNSTVLTWGNLTWGGTYSKNVTVTNICNRTIQIMLITYPPNGTVQTWMGNNTVLNAAANVSAPLLLTVYDSPPNYYEWTINFNYEAVNQTATVTPTPTSTPTPTATPPPTA